MKDDNIPLIVDLDNTLINTDLLFESSKLVLRNKPFLIINYIFWFLRGKGYLKEQLFKRCEINIKELPYNKEVIAYIKEQKKLKRRIVLATASYKNYAYNIAKHLNIFDDVMASNKYINLSGKIKAEKLKEKFGDKNFDYMGDHMRDMPVWKASNKAILVNASKRIIKNTKNLEVFILSEK